MRSSKISHWATWPSLLLCSTSLPVLADSAVDQVQLAAANTAFGFDLFGQIAQEQPDANVFIYPFSVSKVLRMLDNGAVGATRQSGTGFALRQPYPINHSL